MTEVCYLNVGAQQSVHDEPDGVLASYCVFPCTYKLIKYKQARGIFSTVLFVFSENGGEFQVRMKQFNKHICLNVVFLEYR